MTLLDLHVIEVPVILKDCSPFAEFPLPSDNLSDSERLNRLFLDTGKRWRLLAVLCYSKGASQLLAPELMELSKRFGIRGLMIRVVYLSDENPTKIIRSLPSWNNPNTRATGMDIHAVRIVGDGPLPVLRLYDPEGSMEYSFSGFDTEEGLDELTEKLEMIFESDTVKAE